LVQESLPGIPTETPIEEGLHRTPLPLAQPNFYPKRIDFIVYIVPNLLYPWKQKFKKEFKKIMLCKSQELR